MSLTTVESNALPFVVVEETGDLPLTGLEVHVYDSSANYLDMLPEARAKALSAPVTGEGAWSFEVRREDKRAFPPDGSPLIERGNYVQFRLHGRAVFLGYIDRDYTEDVTDEASRWVSVEGPGALAALRTAVLYGERGLKTQSKRRLFTIGARDYSIAHLPFAQQVAKQGSGASPWADFPVQWPDGDAWWICAPDHAYDEMPFGLWYVARNLVLDDPIDAFIFATADDSLEFFLDGELLFTGNQEYAWRRPFGKAVTLEPGVHRLAAVIRNRERASGSSASAFLCTVSAEGSAGAFDVNELQEVYIDANGGNFKLGFRGEVTADIPWGSSPAVVKGALEALTTVSSVEVVGSGDPYTVEFTGTHAASPQPLMVLHPAGLVADDGSRIERLRAGGSSEVVLRSDDSWRVDSYPAEPAAMTPGQLLLTVDGEADARDVAYTEALATGVTTEEDADGLDWEWNADMEFAIGDDYVSALEELVEAGVDMDVLPNFQIGMWNNRGVDRTGQIGANPPVEFRLGRNLSSWSRESPDKAPPNALMLLTSDGYTEQSLAAPLRREGFLSVESAKSPSMVSRVVQTILNEVNSEGFEVAAVAGVGPRPFIDVEVGDLARVYRPPEDGEEVEWDGLRVESISLKEVESGQIEVVYEFGPSRSAALLRIEQWLYRMENGTLRGRLRLPQGGGSFGGGGGSDVGGTVADVGPGDQTVGGVSQEYVDEAIDDHEVDGHSRYPDPTGQSEGDVPQVNATGDGWIYGAAKHVETVGDGAATTYSVVHAFGDEDVVVQVRDVVTGEVDASVTIDVVDDQQVDVTFMAAPATDSKRVVIVV